MEETRVCHGFVTHTLWTCTFECAKSWVEVWFPPFLLFALSLPFILSSSKGGFAVNSVGQSWLVGRLPFSAHIWILCFSLCWLQVGRTQQVCQCATARPSSADRSEARLHGNRPQSSAGEQRWLPSSPPLFIIGDSVPNCSRENMCCELCNEEKDLIWGQKGRV